MEMDLVIWQLKSVFSTDCDDDFNVNPGLGNCAEGLSCLIF